MTEYHERSERRKKITGLAGFGINYTLTHHPERSQGAEYLNNDYEQVPIYFRIAFAIIMLCAIRFALDNGYGIAAFVLRFYLYTKLFLRRVCSFVNVYICRYNIFYKKTVYL